MSSLHYLRNFIDKKVLFEYSYGNQKQYGIITDVEYNYGLYCFDVISSLKFCSDYPNYRIKNICDKEHFTNSNLGTFIIKSDVVKKIYWIQDSKYNSQIIVLEKLLGKKLNSDIIAIIKDFIAIELLDVWWNNL